MTTDANRPRPDPLKDQDVSNALDNCDHKLITYVLNKLLADRLAQAQREAEQAALETAAEVKVPNHQFGGTNGLDVEQKIAIRSLKPGTALELAKLRERLEEAEWWAEGKHDGVSDTCVKCERIADLRNRKLELERRPQLERE